MVYVNGTSRAGDAYDNGWLRLPVPLREGTNEFLFHVARGEMVATLQTPPSPALLDQKDATLPDLIVGETEPKWAALWVINASDEPLSDVKLVCQASGGGTRETSTFEVPPLSVRKVPFQIEAAVDAVAEKVERTVQLVRPDGEEQQVLDELSLELRVVQPTERHVRTFISEMDGSVQPYAVQPATAEGSQPLGLILSLHGAAIEAATQASYYSAKPWAHVVAPTNRRPYGFDWEDWGRVDALEVLADAEKRLQFDANRIFLTGHSMGGHGAWHLGSTYPGQFAAVAPSGGWISFESYTTAGTSADTPTARILERAANPSQTLALKSNLAATGVYVLHGSDDEKVPVREARQMRQALAEFHRDFAYYERSGAGHWWGSESIDWPPMMDYFQHHELPDAKDVERIDFTTMNPGISARSGWLTIEAQETQFAPSTAEIECDAEDREFLGTTTNIARIALDVSHLEPGASIRIELDNQRLRDVRWPNVTRTIWLEKDGSRWRASDPPSPSLKGPHRYGLFKDAFRNRPVLVYGTRGNDDENRWAFAKARFDAETFLYRGNGTLEVVSDRDFNPTELEDRNVVLYGNADTNRAWPSLLSTCPIQIRRGSVRVGLRSELGDDLACLFIYPRRGSGTASVGVVSGTGLEGMHLTNRLRYFVSGVAYPDLVIFDSSVLREGGSAIRAAGFFGLDWQLETGDIAWRDLAL
jgi:dienelactone hydrolase